MLDLGNASIAQIVDDLQVFALDHLLPSADRGRIAAERGWLAPTWLAPTWLGGDDGLILSFHSFVVRTAHHTVLVDTCLGNDKERPTRPSWHRRRGDYLARLAAAGLRPEDVDIVLCTHLHADHVGWNTRLQDGRWVPTFPRARYLMGRREVAHWQARAAAEPALNHGSWADSVAPILDGGRAVLVDDDHAIDDMLVLSPAPGHTPGGVVLHLAASRGRAMFCGDAVHHPVQGIDPAWSSRFCADPLQAAATRARLLDEAVDSACWFLPAHFAGPPFVRMRRAGGVVRPVA
jgi:glyoxylase-like metal-dependent hydrolase (beta-lactamase superfamily II)